MSQDKEFYGTFVAVIAGLAVLAIILVYTAISLTSEVSEYKPDDVVIEFIKPVGEVYVAGVSEPDGADASTPAGSTGAATGAITAVAKTGEEVYNANCMACHAAGVAGAPKLGDTGAWAPRIALGVNALVSSVINGKGVMPAKGGCASCSDDELKTAVEYMVGKSR